MPDRPFDLKNVKTKEDFANFCDHFHLNQSARVNHQNGTAFIADGTFHGIHYTIYALGRDEQSLVIGRAITWKEDQYPNTTEQQRVSHAVDLATEFMAAWPEYKNIAHEYRKHMDA